MVTIPSKRSRGKSRHLLYPVAGKFGAAWNCRSSHHESVLPDAVAARFRAIPCTRSARKTRWLIPRPCGTATVCEPRCARTISPCPSSALPWLMRSRWPRVSVLAPAGPLPEAGGGVWQSGFPRAASTPPIRPVRGVPPGRGAPEVFRRRPEASQTALVPTFSPGGVVTGGRSPEAPEAQQTAPVAGFPAASESTQAHAVVVAPLPPLAANNRLQRVPRGRQRAVVELGDLQPLRDH